MRSIITNGLIITVNEEQEIFKNGSLVFEDDKITYLGDKIEDISGFDNVIDVKGNIVMPGLINTHGHTPMSLLRGYGDDLSLKNWLEDKMWPLEAQFTTEHVNWGSKLAIIEMLKTGTTTFLDMYIHMDIVAKAVEKSGIRATLTRSILGFGTEEQKKAKLIDARIFAKEWNNKANGRIKTMMAPHSTYTCSPDYIEKMIEIAHELNLPVHTHVAETENEVKEHYQKYGMSPVKQLEKIGFFDLPALIAHAVFLDNEDIKICCNNDVCIAHNPISNLKLGSGIAPIPEYLRRGLCVSLGTDSAASNNSLNLFEELRMAALIHKGTTLDAKVISANTALEMATINGAKSLFRDEEIGSLEIGKKADFIVLDKKQSNSYPMYNPISHIAYSASGQDVKDVFIDGIQVLKNGKVLFIDEEEVYTEVKKLTNKW